MNERPGSAAILPLALACVAAPSGARAPMCTASVADTAQVASTVRAFYETERTGDSVRWRGMLTPDFYNFHEGVTIAPTDFAKWTDRERAGLEKDKAARWTMDLIDLKVTVDCTTAFTTQTLHGVVEVPSRGERGHFDESYQESMLLRKPSDAGWRIAFWHVTQVPKSATASQK